MESNFLPSLFHLALAKVAAGVCYDSEIRNFIGKFSENWKILLNKKLITLKLPTELQIKITGVLRPIILEIEEWMENHEFLLDSDINLLPYICWKSEGTINRKQTAVTLIGNENLDISKRFILACNYCLKDEILHLWNMMPENEQALFDSEETLVVHYWITWIRKGTEPLRYWSKISHTADTLPYFLQKLTSADRRWSLMIGMFPEFIMTDDLTFRERILYDLNGFGKINSVYPLCLKTDVIRLFLSQMDRDQQIELIKQSPLRVLECFLNWPLQSAFMAVLRDLWVYLSEEYFLCLLQLILYKKIAFGFEDFNYVELLKEVWLESPEHYKAYVKEDDIYHPLINTITYGMLFAAGIKHDFSSEFSVRRSR
ncbi:hypothetical protein AVEN_264752-1 [Araneus ventricosus]|uniref:Uncharacterized protein n=1 Tax=Araneus ventricosus TaxID=182803 RepID=A0A4Y2EF49_ARAVE|nr:hypothetical protein AVEN_264752-1 [Araneus ventricosus]